MYLLLFVDNFSLGFVNLSVKINGGCLLEDQDPSKSASKHRTSSDIIRSAQSEVVFTTGISREVASGSLRCRYRFLQRSLGIFPQITGDSCKRR